MLPCTDRTARDCTGNADPEITSVHICLPCAIARAEARLDALYHLRNHRDLTDFRKRCKRCNRPYPKSHLSAYGRCPACADAVEEFDGKAMNANDLLGV